jgi:hypothetical protein
MKRGLLFLLMLSASGWAGPVLAFDATVSTLWPIYDYRASESADYQSLHMFGPFIKYESKGGESEFSVRPFFYSAADDENTSKTDVLYPVFSYKSDSESSSSNIIQLFSIDHSGGASDGGASDAGVSESGASGRRNRHYIFPFLFYGEEEQGTYKAFFPIAGTLYNWFGRDRISFVLFPLYSHTERKTRQIDNVLWPIFAKISGENESGYKFWPIYGQSSKQGVYRKKFFLWPIFFSEDLKQDTENPEEVRAAWPLYIRKSSPKKSYEAFLWPFFSRTENYAKEYSSFNAPWPLVRVTEGEKYHGVKVLPFYSDETMDVQRQRWYVWPIYKIEEMHTELIERRRDRVLFFLYSDTNEAKFETGDSMRRVALWPLFGYLRKNGVSHLHVLALLEPFFPDNQSIERLWAPLWRIYQEKWDQQGNHVVSLLWNLYWLERQGEKVAWELFPLIKYHKESERDKELSVLKGLFSYRSGESGKQLNVLYTPWGLRWGAPQAEQQ